MPPNTTAYIIEVCMPKKNAKKKERENEPARNK